MITVNNVHFSYGKKKILNGITFSVRKKEIIALIGVSGSGKTTLFRLITGLISQDEGKIEIAGHNDTLSSLHTTYMRQEDLLLPWRTVMQNLLLFGELGKKRKDPIYLKEEAKILLMRLGLTACEDAYPNQLSGGMRQRVSLARALLQNRPLLLLDEPFASLDVIIREELYTLLREIKDQFDKTIIMVTHDFRDALAVADRILILSQGKISDIFEVKGNKEDLSQKIRERLNLQSTFKGCSVCESL